MSSYPPSPRSDWLASRDGHDVPLGAGGDGSAYDCFEPLDSRRFDLESVRGLHLDEKLALLDALTADVSTRVADERFGGLGADDVLVANRVLDRCARRVRSVQLEAITAIDDKGLYLDDGFRSPKAMLVHSLRLSGPAANRMVKTARALKGLPCARQAYAEGRLGSCQADQIGRVYGNPRIRDAVVQCDELFTEDATQVGFDDFAALVKEFARLADQDGAEKKDDRNHEKRSASLTEDFDGGWTLHGTFASAQGAALKEIFDRFADTEFQADLQAAREQFGDKVPMNQLERTAGQRSADALYQVFLQAASADPGSELPLPLVTIVFHKGDLEDTVNRQTTGDATADPTRYRRSRSSTTNGAHVDRRAALSAALMGHIRRVIERGDGVTINQGRKQRLFTGSARDAALISELRCNYATCGVPARLCQIDHLMPWSELGETDQENAGPKCGYHNRWATKGFRTWRDEDGRWHTYRPDGTEIL